MCGVVMRVVNGQELLQEKQKSIIDIRYQLIRECFDAIAAFNMLLL